MSSETKIQSALDNRTPEISLKDALEFIVDNRGKTAPTEATGITLIATSCVNNKDLYPRKINLRYVSQDTYDNWFRSHPRPGDILLTNKGSQNGAVCLVPDPVDFCIAQDMVALRANSKKIDPLYLFAALRSELVQKRIKALNVDGVIPHIKKTDFDKILIPIPDRASQNFIGEMYFQISNRIELLQETNATLRAISGTLFKSWFVDFDPVRAKQGGRLPEGMDITTTALFPDQFQESVLGAIPSGWVVGSVGQLARVIDCLHAKKPELIDSGKPFLQLDSIRDDGILDVSRAACISQENYEKWINRIEVYKGDCLITNVGRVGAVAQVPPDFRAAMGRNMTAIRMLDHLPYPTYMIELLQSAPMRAEIERRTDVGTILNALNVRNIPLLRCILPPNDVLEVFEALCRPIRAAMEANLKRTVLLADLRDTLLPRLISGKLQPCTVAEFMKQAA